MTSTYIINHKDKKNSMETLNAVSENVPDNSNVTIMEVVSTGNPMLNEQNFMLPDTSEYYNFSENIRGTNKTSDIFNDMIKKDTKSQASINLGFIVLEVPNVANLNEDFIGFDFFNSKTKVIEYLNLRGAQEFKDLQVGSWSGIHTKREVGNHTSGQSSYCFDSSPFFNIEMEKKDAMIYMENSAKGNKFSGKDPLRKSKMKTSRLYVINCERINIDIFPDETICGYPKSKQRILYLFEVINKWLNDFRRRWVEVSTNDRNFVYAFKKVEGWSMPSFDKKYTINEFKKDLNFSLSPFWANFMLPDLSPEKKCQITIEFLSAYNVFISMENLTGGLNDSSIVHDFLRNNGIVIAQPKSHNVYFKNKEKKPAAKALEVNFPMPKPRSGKIFTPSS